MKNGILTETDGANSITRRYVYGPGEDEPVVWYEGAGLTDRRWLHTDERGSVIAITNGSGTVTNINSYDDHGIPGALNTGRFQYTGQAWLPDLGMYYYKARMYSPTLGRFMQTDPIGYGDGPNWYAYAHGDPVNGRDPKGTELQYCTGSLLPCGGSGGNTGTAGDFNPFLSCYGNCSGSVGYANSFRNDNGSGGSAAVLQGKLNAVQNTINNLGSGTSSNADNNSIFGSSNGSFQDVNQILLPQGTQPAVFTYQTYQKIETVHGLGAQDGKSSFYSVFFIDKMVFDYFIVAPALSSPNRITSLSGGGIERISSSLLYDVGFDRFGVTSNTVLITGININGRLNISNVLVDPRR